MKLELSITRKKLILLFVCLGLGILAEICFFHGRIGLSLLVFVIVLYSLILLKYRLAFNHRRIGLLFTFTIWALSGSYLLYDHHFFYYLNLIIIPILIFSHLIIITSPNTFRWNTPYFLALLTDKLLDGIHYSLSFVAEVMSTVYRPLTDEMRSHIRLVMKGLVYSVPLFLFVSWLFAQADSQFHHLLISLLDFKLLQVILRLLFILLFGLILFGLLQTLAMNSKTEQIAKRKPKKRWNGLTAITVLVVQTGVYLLYIFGLMNKGFNGQAEVPDPFTEFTSKSFFAFILIAIINLSLIISFLKLVKVKHSYIDLTLKSLYSLLILINLFMLYLAYQRLSMYEMVYGFTFSSIIAHSLIIFLMVILIYTLIHVWLEKISLLHFYLIIGLIFYTALNAINIEKIIVDKNIERYIATEQIDFDYLDSLSYTGWDGLIQLYELGEDDPALLQLLTERKEWIEQQPASSWQSFNFTKQRVEKKLTELSFK